MSTEDSDGSITDGERGDWSDNLAHATSGEPTTVPVGANTDRSRWWVLGVYLGSVLLLYGAFAGGALVLFTGYLMIPIAMYLDAAYLEAITPGWKRDSGLVLLGCLLFPVLMVPYHLYQRWEVDQ